ncbi:MAG: carbohydrate ABC transporter substrate-binding protein, partial [Chloroflexota bacterium]
MKKLTLLIVLLLLVSLGVVVVVSAQDDAPIIFASTQFNVVEETEKAKQIVAGFEDGAADFTVYEAGPLLDLLKAESDSGTGTIGLVGDLHGGFPSLASQDMLFDLTDLLGSIEKTSNVNDAFVELGKMGTTDTQYYIPWAQATYVMAANKDALQYLPEGADVNALTWAQLAAWGK